MSELVILGRVIGTISGLDFSDILLIKISDFVPVPECNLPANDKYLIDFADGLFVKLDIRDGKEYVSTYDILEYIKNIELLDKETNNLVDVDLRAYIQTQREKLNASNSGVQEDSTESGS